MEVCLWYPALIDVYDSLLGLVYLKHLLSIEITKNPIELTVTLEGHSLDLTPGESKLPLHDRLYLVTCNRDPRRLFHQALDLLH